MKDLLRLPRWLALATCSLLAACGEPTRVVVIMPPAVDPADAQADTGKGGFGGDAGAATTPSTTPAEAGPSVVPDATVAADTHIDAGGGSNPATDVGTPSSPTDTAAEALGAADVAPAGPGAPVITEFAVPGGPHRGLAAGKDGVYFATAAGKIARIDGAGKVTEFATTLPSPSALALGPDDNIWITNLKGNIVSRLTPAGEFKHHNISSTVATSIVAGPDLSLWFTGQALAARGIGRMTVTGQASNFPVSAGYLPKDIVKGADGALWFTLQEELHKGGKLGRITTAGVVTEFPVGGAEVPDELALASDGRIWFTTESTNVGFLVAGTTTTTRFLEVTRGIRSLAAAEDGTLWFTVATRPALIRVKPNGDQNATLAQLGYKEITEGVSAPTTFIAPGAGRTLWFLTTTDKIGRIQY